MSQNDNKKWDWARVKKVYDEVMRDLFKPLVLVMLVLLTANSMMNTARISQQDKLLELYFENVELSGQLDDELLEADTHMQERIEALEETLVDALQDTLDNDCNLSVIEL